jgi:S1-C subfamily serine protease
MRTRTALAILTVLILTSTAESADYRKLFAQANPSVVVLYTIERQVAPQTELGEVALPGLGSGFVVDNEGHVMTAAHVVQTADLVQVEFIDGTKVTAAVVASDPVKDVALLKLDKVPEGLKPAKLGDSEKVRVGDEIFVIGAPYGLTHTLTVGHISARHKNESGAMGVVRAETFQTDAAINQGNSGGPMFNQHGEVVGIVSYIRTQSGGSDGLGFAVTSNAAVEALIEERMRWSGMSGTVVTGQLAKALNVPQQSGYLVQKVAANSPAARLGLMPSKIPAIIGGQQVLIGGDIILAIEGVKITPDVMGDVRRELPDIKPGSIIKLTILRAGKVIELSAPF